MNCDFEPASYDDGRIKWRCTREHCRRETGWIKSTRAPLATCRERELSTQEFTPPSKAPLLSCEHRGPIVDTLRRESCGCDEQPLYQCSLYGEQVTLRRHKKIGRNCLDCKLDAEESAEQVADGLVEQQ